MQVFWGIFEHGFVKMTLFTHMFNLTCEDGFSAQRYRPILTLCANWSSNKKKHSLAGESCYLDPCKSYYMLLDATCSTDFYGACEMPQAGWKLITLTAFKEHASTGRPTLLNTLLQISTNNAYKKLRPISFDVYMYTGLLFRLARKILRQACGNLLFLPNITRCRICCRPTRATTCQQNFNLKKW